MLPPWIAEAKLTALFKLLGTNLGALGRPKNKLIKNGLNINFLKFIIHFLKFTSIFLEFLNIFYIHDFFKVHKQFF